MEFSIRQDEIKDYLKLKMLSRLARVKEKIKIFEKKYSMEFPQFEEKVLNSEEHFEMWDDYIEWKSYEGLQHNLNHELENIDRAEHIKVIR